MTITERVMLPGSWSLNLDPNTPPSVLATVDLASAAFGHIIVTPTHLGTEAVSGATLLAASRYTGILRERPSKYELGGPGLAAWIADEDGKGDVLESALTKVAGTFVQWVTDLRPSSLDAGTYTAIGGTLSHTFDRINRREALDYVCTYFGAEWKVDPTGTLHAGTAANLFTSTPTVVVQPRSGGKDLNVTGINAEVGVARDMDDYTTRVFLIGGAGTGSANISPATSFKDLNGNAVDLTRIIESTDTGAGNENTVAQGQLNRFTAQRRALTLSSDVYDLGQDIDVGDAIYVYDPEQGLTDTANQVQYRGQVIFPLSTRCLGRTWPVRRGMGVYFRAPDAGGTITDLTDWVAWESGATTVEVGATPRSINS